jgi:colanic acid/amylovoran biosynthesis glycosyltransferase
MPRGPPVHNRPSVVSKRVAVFSTNFLPYSQTFVYDQVTHHAYEPEVFCWRRMYEDRFPFSPVHVAPVTYGATRRSARFRRRFDSVRFDVVHAHFAPGAVYAAPYAKRAAAPLIVTFHGYDVPLYRNTVRFHPAYWPFLLNGRKILREMTVGLCASEELRALLVELGVAEAKLRVHRLGIDLNRFSPASRHRDGPDV